MTYIELAKHVTGRERHQVQIGGIPRRHDNASIFRVVLDLVDAVAKLIDTLSGIVGMHIDIGGAKVAPLKAIDGSQVTHLAMGQATLIEKLSRAVAVPNVDVLGSQQIGIRASLVFSYKKVGQIRPTSETGGASENLEHSAIQSMFGGESQLQSKIH